MLIFAAGQILGPRDNQEDTILAGKASTFQRSKDVDWDPKSSGLFAVADGMGGHEKGEEASREAADALNTSVSECVNLHDAFAFANDAVENIPRHFSGHAPGTTLIVLMFDLSESAAKKFHYACGMVTLANIGDSRCYRLRRGFLSPYVKKDGTGDDGEFEQLSKDHTFGRYISRSIGVHPGKYVPPDISYDRVEYGDRYLLCSDGLSNVLTNDEIAAILRGTTTPEEALTAFLALDGKDPKDNTSVIVIDVVRPPPPPPVENRPRLRFERKQPALIVTFGDTTDPEAT